VSHVSNARPLVAGLLAIVGALACQPLDRTEGFGNGEVRVTVVDAEGEPIEGARVRVPGSPRVAISSAGGLAVLRGLVVGDYALHIGVDDDGDGRDDRAVVRAGDTAMVRTAEVGGARRHTSVVTGPIALEPSGSIAGTLPGLLPDELARVVVVRRVVLGADASAREVQLPVEGSGGVTDDGSFAVEGLAAGEVILVALTWVPSSSPEPLQQLIAASRPTRFAVQAAQVGSGDVVVANLEAVPALVTLTLELAGDIKPVRNAGQVVFSVPLDGPDVAGALVGTIEGLAAASPRVVVDAPLSVFDLRVQLDGVPVPTSVSPVVGLVDITLLPVPVGLDPDCQPRESDDEHGAVDGCGGDLDGDGLLDDDDDDDDADGVDDADEPTACRLIGLGADRDGDCLCDAVDPFADCASNDPVDCDPVAPISCE
jgi:hypothetical protein